MTTIPWYKSARVSYLERQNELLVTKLLEALDVSQVLNVKLADGVDRVLMSKFDAPLMPKAQAQPMREQPFADVSDVLSVEDDGEFVERMEGLTR